MFEKVVLLVLGFVMTTIVGGFLGTFLQHRSWRHRWETEKLEQKISTSRKFFEEISRLMDKRIYRVAQLYLWSRKGIDKEVTSALENYRTVVFEWNDSINRYLAILQIFFGKEIRDKFDFQVGKKFVDVGAAVEHYYRDRKKHTDERDKVIDQLIAELRAEVYEYNLQLLEAIEAMSLNNR